MPEPPEEQPDESGITHETGPSGHEPDEERGRLSRVVAARRETLERLKARGVPPFALNFAKDADAADVLREFDSLERGQETDQVRTVAGRIVMLRRLGGVAFVVIRDRSGDLQLFCSQDSMDEGSWALLDDLDLGDIVGAAGPVVKTKRGEVSVKPTTVTLLTKSLHPPPEKWAGIRDPELKVRRRYVQLFADPTYRKVVQTRAKILKSMRSVLDAEGFLEVETPVLQITQGGALATPFLTHHKVLDVDLFLRIAPELYLKRILVGGLERVYEIGRNFRNEGIDRDHNPEFTMFEAYQAYGDYETMKELTRELIQRCALAVNGSTTVATSRGVEIDLGGEWRRVTVLGVVSETLGEAVSLDDPGLEDLARRYGVQPEPGWGPGKLVLELFEKHVEQTLLEPTFVCDFPREVSPLARPHRDDPRLTEHFDLVAGGVELVTAFSELTDPIEQRAKFELQQAM